MLNATASGVVVCVSFALLGSAALTRTAEAQERPQVRIGERIRLTLSENSSVTDSIRLSGTLIERRADTLVVQVSPESAPVTVPVTSIRQLDTHRRPFKQVVRPTLIGAGAGAVTFGGLYLVLEFASGCLGSCSSSPAAEAFGFVSTGAILGAMAGAVYGTYVIVVHPWRRVRLPVQTGIVTRRDGRITRAATVPSGRRGVQPNAGREVRPCRGRCATGS